MIGGVHGDISGQETIIQQIMLHCQCDSMKLDGDLHKET